MSDHECVRCPQCDSCPVCAADALDREVVENENLTAAWEAHKKAYEIVGKERDRLREALREILDKAECTCSPGWHGPKRGACAGVIARRALAASEVKP